MSLPNQPAAERRAAHDGLLLPREHGAYAGIVFPLITALSLGRPNWVQALWAAGAIALFLAHEPLLVLAGERGNRARTELGKRARTQAFVLSLLAVTAGGLGWWWAPPAARLAVNLPLVLGAILMALILNHRERSLPGEILASLTLSSMLLPVALAGGVTPQTAIVGGAVWAAVSSLGTLTVRATIARAKQAANHRRLRSATIAFSAAALLALLLLTRANVLPALAAAAIVPAALLAVVLSLMHVHPRHLRAVGWSLVGSNVITLIALTVGLRWAGH